MQKATVIYIPPPFTSRNIRASPHSFGESEGKIIGTANLGEILGYLEQETNNEGTWFRVTNSVCGWILASNANATYVELIEVPNDDARIAALEEAITRLSTIAATHKVQRTTGSGSIKGRAAESGEELFDIKSGKEIQLIFAQDTSKYVRVLLGDFPVIVAIDDNGPNSDWKKYVVAI